MKQVLATVEATRSSLNRIEFMRALLQSIGIAFAVFIIARVAVEAIAHYRPTAEWLLSSRSTIGTVLLAVGGGVVGWLAVKPRSTLSDAAAALWIEERNRTEPTFALVTAVEQSSAVANAAIDDDLFNAPLFRAAARLVNESVVAEALRLLQWSRLRLPLIFVILSLFVALAPLFVPAIARVSRTIAFGANDTGAGASSKVPLFAESKISVRVLPPAYTGFAHSSIDNPQTVRALSGSRIEISGVGPRPEVESRYVLSGVSRRISSDTTKNTAISGWKVTTVADSLPVVLNFTRASDSRQLIIEGYRDSIPHVTISLPERDSVLRVAAGSIQLSATAKDDIGLTRVGFELLVTSGEGERFTVRSLTMGVQNWKPSEHQRSAQLSSSLNLSALELAEGDVIHIRAVARDGNPSLGRDAGSSETRSLRIARRGEYDSLSVEPVPPPDVDKSLLSQRMLLLLTEKLDARKKQLKRAQVVEESQRIAGDQAKLRQSVGDIVFQRLSGEASGEHSHFPGDGHDHGVEEQGGKLSFGAGQIGVLEEGDDSPVIAVNKPLLEAYNAMWDAGRALELGDPHAAIPPMRRALDAIERSRTMSRIYLRGAPPRVVIDLAKVRLAGKDTGTTTNRPTRDAAPLKNADWDSRIVRAAQVLATGSVAPARDSLALLRVEALESLPSFAAAIDRVLSALEVGGDITGAFIEARRNLHTVVRTNGSEWSRSMPP